MEEREKENIGRRRTPKVTPTNTFVRPVRETEKEKRRCHNLTEKRKQLRYYDEGLKVVREYYKNLGV